MAYAYPPRNFSPDRVAQQLYEGANLVEEVYRAVGGDALPFYSMLAPEGDLRRKLQEAAKAYLESLHAIFAAVGVFNSDGDRLDPRLLKVEWEARADNPREPLFTTEGA